MRFFTMGVLSVWIAVASSLLFSGCSSDSNSTGNQLTSTIPSVAAVSPANGATQVPRITTIGMRFNTPMDTSSVMGAFHLSGGPHLSQWMDSVGHHQGMGHMAMMDMDHMMQWMDSIEFRGQWHWNDTKDSCWFVPDSMLVADADHMIYLYGDMYSQMGVRMNMDTMQYGGLMSHFHTQP